MKHIFTISLCFLALSLSAQETITYPYNPDGDADGLVAVPDIQDLLAVYGSPFSPAEIMVGDTALSEWIQILYQALEDQQAVINAMQGAGGCSYSFPEGLDGEIVNHDFANGPYIVPTGKNLYVRHMFTIAYSIVKINSIVLASSTNIHTPLYLGENDVFDSDNATFQGILLDSTNIQPIHYDLNTAEPYIVPVGKKLVVQYLYSEEILNEIYINEILIAEGYIGYDFIDWKTHILILSSGEELNGVCVNCAFNGYLVDEDYFADCGGGGSSEEVDEEELGPCQGEFTVNYHGYDYELVEIGEQCWFAENLRTDKFSNGDDLLNEYFGPDLPAAGTAHCELEEYGFLYNSSAAKDERNVCPNGWKVPFASEFSELLSATSGQSLHNGPNGFNGSFAGILQYEIAVGEPNGCNIAGIGNLGKIHLSDESVPGPLTLWTGDIQRQVGSMVNWWGIPIRCIKD